MSEIEMKYIIGNVRVTVCMKNHPKILIQEKIEYISESTSEPSSLVYPKYDEKHHYNYIIKFIQITNKIHHHRTLYIYTQSLWV